MSDQLKKCSVCDEQFRWNADVIIVDDELYHKDCVELYPTSYFAMLDGEVLGVTENEDGQCAFDVLEEGEYMEDEE